MCALIATRRKYNTKKQLCDNAIAYADMLMRRLGEIPADAQQRSEAGQDINYNFTKLWTTKKGTAMPLIEEIRGNQGKNSPNQQHIGTAEHIKIALDVIDKKGGEE